MPEQQTASSSNVSIISDRGPIIHDLKCWPKFFDAIADGRKRHDLRRSTDRDFRVGDVLNLLEFDPSLDDYTGRSQLVKVTYVTSADLPCALSEQALHESFCILSIATTARAQ